MMSSSDEAAGTRSRQCYQNNYKGIRYRKWGKWVSEIRVPGSRERLWLGSYSTPEAAAIAHDIAFYCLRLRRPSTTTTSLELADKLNFPLMLPASVLIRTADMSPRSIQKAASDAGMAIDAQQLAQPSTAGGTLERRQTTVLADHHNSAGGTTWEARNHNHELITEGEEALNISIEDYL